MDTYFSFAKKKKIKFLQKARNKHTLNTPNY